MIDIKIRSFEAQRQIFYMLCGTVAIHGLNNIYCHNVAVGKENSKEFKILLPDYNSNNNFGGLEFMTPQRSDNQSMIKKNYEIIEMATLDSFNEPVDFIKMDIEGMEDKAVIGSLKIIEKHRPIFFMEILKTDVQFIKETFTTKNYNGFKRDADIIQIPAEYKITIEGLPRFF